MTKTRRKFTAEQKAAIVRFGVGQASLPLLIAWVQE